MSSYWSKRRKMYGIVEDKLQNIAMVDGIASDNYLGCKAEGFQSGNHSFTDGSVSSDGFNTTESVMLECDDLGGVSSSSEKESTLSSDCDSDSFDYSDGDSTDESDPDDDPDVDVKKDNSLTFLLACWAVQYNITHIALGALLIILRLFHSGLPKDPRTILATGGIGSMKSILGGMYMHLGIENALQNKINSEQGLRLQPTLHLQINIDGLPLFKSSGMTLWPILGRLEESVATEPFAIGIFAGKEKPKNVHEYLHDFIVEMETLQNLGMMYQGLNYCVRISNVICDTPARAFVKQVKGHTGYSGCDRCTANGQYTSNRMTFPDLNAEVRTDSSFSRKLDEEHHNGESPFQKLTIGMISKFPLDYMHLVCLGVTKRWILTLLQGPLKTRLGTQVVSNLSAAQLALRSAIPADFARKPRAFSDVTRWKATEFRLFLLYTGLLTLVGKVPDEIYKNFLLLSVSIRILVSPTLCQKWNSHAHELLKNFIEHCSQLFGEQFVVYNVHGLIHLPAEVAIHGPLDKFSSFPFENYLGKIKRMVRKGNQVIQQVFLRLKEQSTFAKKENGNTACKVSVKKVHFAGPIPSRSDQDFSSYSQNEEMIMSDTFISVRHPNNCVKAQKNIAIVVNVLQNENETFIVFRNFKSKRAFFQYPMSSVLIGIEEVSDLDQGLKVCHVDEIEGKYCLFPYRHNFVAMPVIHTL